MSNSRVPRATKSRSKKTPESYVLDVIMDYLAAKHIFAMRMNSGQIGIRENGAFRLVKLHEPGTADILALPKVGSNAADLWDAHLIQPLWIEAKAGNGVQSPLQKSFQQKVESEGHRYVLAYSLDDVIKEVEG